MYFILEIPYSKKTEEGARALQKLISKSNNNIDNITFFKQSGISDKLASTFFKKRKSIYCEYEVYRHNSNLISIEINHAEMNSINGKTIRVSYTGSREPLHTHNIFKQVLTWLIEKKDMLSIHEYSYIDDTNLQWWEKDRNKKASVPT